MRQRRWSGIAGESQERETDAAGAGTDGRTSEGGAGRIATGARAVTGGLVAGDVDGVIDGVIEGDVDGVATAVRGAGCRAPCATIVRRGGIGSVESGMSRIATSAASRYAAVSAACRSSAATAVSSAPVARARLASFRPQPAAATIATLASIQVVALVVIGHPVGVRSACMR